MILDVLQLGWLFITTDTFPYHVLALWSSLVAGRSVGLSGSAAVSTTSLVSPLLLQPFFPTPHRPHALILLYGSRHNLGETSFIVAISSGVCHEETPSLESADTRNI